MKEKPKGASVPAEVPSTWSSQEPRAIEQMERLRVDCALRINREEDPAGTRGT